jgi:hypothetical protein
MESLYERYSNYVGSISETSTLSGFKSNPVYTEILEHVTEYLGENYLKYILSLTPLTVDEIVEFCSLNDAIGDPTKVNYTEHLSTASVSPTSLRYIFHAHLILTHMKKMGQLNPDVVEVGGGYGGLCFSLHHFAPKYGISIKSYRLCDLPNIIRLQKIYLSRVNPSLQIEYVDATTYGENIACDGMFLISNYCFSEISKENQDSYRKTLFPKVAHGFMAWNVIPVYDFGFRLRVESEYPNTGWDMNKYVYF